MPVSRSEALEDIIKERAEPSLSPDQMAVAFFPNNDPTKSICVMQQSTFMRLKKLQDSSGYSLPQDSQTQGLIETYYNVTRKGDNEFIFRKVSIFEPLDHQMRI